MSRIPGRSGIPQPGQNQGAIPRPTGIQPPRAVAGPSTLQQPQAGISRIQPPRAGGVSNIPSGIPNRNIAAATFGRPKITVVEDAERPTTGGGKKKKKKESLMQWFDKNAEKSLLSQRNKTAKPPLQIGQSRGLRHPLVVSSSASGIDVTNRLRSAQDTDLAQAVEKLATAEAMCAFEGAVLAAEQAAQRAPPELAEEAAAAGARGYQSLITSVVREKIPGVKPIEVVGYVGITRPKRHLGSHV